MDSANIQTRIGVNQDIDILNPCYKNRKELLRVSDSSIQCLSKVVTAPQIEFLKVPLNFEEVPWKLQRLYIKFLDCKAQNTEGVFLNPSSRKYGASNRQYYRRIIKELINAGWASPCAKTENGNISLRAYQFVWRKLGITRFEKWDKSKFKDHSRKSTGEFYCYFKIWISELQDKRKIYYKQIQEIIQKKLADRRRAQLKWRLNKKGKSIQEATFSSKSSAILFGYRSPATGSKLRKKNFSIISSEDKPFYNHINHRWENPTKKIAL